MGEYLGGFCGEGYVAISELSLSGTPLEDGIRIRKCAILYQRKSDVRMVLARNKDV